MQQRRVLINGTGVIALAAVVFFVMAVPGSEAQEASAEQTLSDNASPSTLSLYSGGAAESVTKVTQDAPTTFTSTTFFSLPSAAARVVVPAGDSDLLNVGFTAECRLSPGATPTDLDWVEIRAQISSSPARPGFPTFMEPYDTTNPMAFCDSFSYAMHHANWAMRPPAFTDTQTIYLVQIQVRVANNAPATPAQTGWLDDWKLELEVHN
jgi:hypothetical protein